MSNLIAIKGSRDGLRLQLDEVAAWTDLFAALREQLDRGAHFFNGARVVVDIGERALADDQLNSLLDLMRHHGLETESLASTSRDSRNAARAAGIAARPLSRPVAESEEQRGDATVVWRTVRSGQIVRHQGHVTVIGDVNPGGEVVAGGSVVVWGRLRGSAHAGALGDRGVVVCALELMPTQLRIADLVGPPREGRFASIPTMARIQADKIDFLVWENNKR